MIHRLLTCTASLQQHWVLTSWLSFSASSCTQNPSAVVRVDHEILNYNRKYMYIDRKWLHNMYMYFSHSTTKPANTHKYSNNYYKQGASFACPLRD